MLIISCLKMVFRAIGKLIMTIIGLVMAYIMVLYIVDAMSHGTTISQNWGSGVTIKDGTCWVDLSTTPGKTREIAQWCTDNGATELVEL